jgi:hypothetical protein
VYTVQQYNTVQRDSYNYIFLGYAEPSEMAMAAAVVDAVAVAVDVRVNREAQATSPQQVCNDNNINITS